MRPFFIAVLLLASFAFGADLSRVARDWPMQRHDAGRTRVTDETLSFPLRCLWRYLPAQPPQPAWPEPPRLPNRLDFDYAPAPVIADNTLYFGSSADDTIRALDAKTGALKWQFTAGGPIRFAPQLENGKVYFAADDGLIYCLQAANGAVVWTFNAAPANEQLIGNRRMISRWPIRTGVLVQDGVLYAVAGIWPAEGIYVYALDAGTGKVVWLNDTDSFGRNPRAGAGGDRWSIGDPHMGEFSMGGLTPQGALLATPNTLLVPLANNAAAQFNIKSGHLNIFHHNSGGSSTPFLDGIMCYTFLGSRGKAETLFGYVIAGEGVRGAAMQYSGTNLLPEVATGDSDSLRTRSLEKVDAIVSGGKRYVRQAGGLALTANALLVGQRDEIVAEDLTTTKTLWRAGVNGLAREIAVADGRVYVATDTGEISCFAPQGTVAATTLVHDARAMLRPWRPEQATPGAAAVVAELKRQHADRGISLVLGDAEGALSCALAAYTSLHVVNVSGDAKAVSALRARLLRETAWYGSRIHAIHVPDLRRLPFAQYVANTVIVAGLEPGLSGKELYRVLHPYGGVLMCPGLEKADAEALMRECDAYEAASHAQSIQGATKPTPVPIASTVGGSASGGKRIGTTPPLEGIISRDPLLGGVPGGRGGFSGDSRGGFSFFVRGALPGARDWNTQPATDQRVKWPLRPIWFGGPNPEQVMNVLIGAHPPVAARGRYFVTGEDCLTAVDAYNGMTLWSRPIPKVVHYLPSLHPWDGGKRLLTADDAHVYLRLGEGWFQGQSEALIRLDAYSGAQQGIYGPYLAPVSVSLMTPQQRSVVWDENHASKVTLSQQSDGIVLTFASPEAMAPSHYWDACFDFRDVERRYGLYEDGAFALMLTPPMTNGAPAKAYQVTGQRFPEYTLRSGSQKGVSELSLIFPWSALEKFVGRRPVSFDLAVAGVRQKEHAGLPAASITRAWQAAVNTSQPYYVFGDGAVRYLNCGWARVILSGPPGAKKPPAILLGELTRRPKDWLFPEPYDWLTIQHPGQLSGVYQTATRAHPLTGEPGIPFYRSGAGYCGFPVYSAHSVIGRSTKTAIGFYDFADDSGLHFFYGPGPNCAVQIKGQNMTAALGVLIFSESRGHCDCMVPIRTSLAFAPAERRLQEDWAVFFDHNLDAPLRQAAVNFGALGDRRDEQGTLWLGYPRFATGKAYPREPGSARFVIQSPPMASSIDLPLKVAGLPRFTGYERLNADSTRIEGTDRPWLYASCLQGVTNLTLTLEPVSSLLAGAAQTQPALDGRLEESFWQTNDFRKVLSLTGTRVALRFDEKNLYIGAYRLSLVDDKGHPVAWVSATKGLDAPIDQDDSMEFFLSDKTNAVVMHLGVAASGARYDALAQGREPERAAWNGDWHSAARADESEFAVEMAIPWTTIKAAGLDKTSLALNLQVNQKNMSAEIPIWAGDLAPKRKEGISAPLLSLGPQGRARCVNFVPLGLGRPVAARPRLFTVRLHFADLRKKADVPRVFDVLLQGKMVLNNFNIVQEAGGTRKALVKEFQHVSATDELRFEFQMPPGVNPAMDTVPVLNGLEVLDEAFAASRPRPQISR